MRIDIMTDIETLGTDTHSTIIQIAAVAFDITTGQVHNEYDFNLIADIEKNKNKLKVTGGTLKWWMKTNPELFEKLLNGGAISSENVLTHFHDWMEQFDSERTYLWGNGILFDNKMIQAQLEAIGLKYPIFYKNDRDVRTILELASQKLGVSESEIKHQVNEKIKHKGFTHHNALDDCYWQVELVSQCFDVLVKEVPQ